MTVSSGRGTARQAAFQRTVAGPPRPPVFVRAIRPRRGILRLHTCHTSLTYLVNLGNSHIYAMATTIYYASAYPRDSCVSREQE